MPKYFSYGSQLPMCWVSGHALIPIHQSFVSNRGDMVMNFLLGCSFTCGSFENFMGVIILYSFFLALAVPSCINLKCISWTLLFAYVFWQGPHYVVVREALHWLRSQVVGETPLGSFWYLFYPNRKWHQLMVFIHPCYSSTHGIYQWYCNWNPPMVFIHPWYLPMLLWHPPMLFTRPWNWPLVLWHPPMVFIHPWNWPMVL